MFRNAELACDYARVEHGSIDVSLVVSTVSQLRPYCDEERTWPVSVAALHAMLDCPVVLLVLMPDLRCGALGARVVRTGHPGFSLEPMVIGFGDVSRITDRA